MTLNDLLDISLEVNIKDSRAESKRLLEKDRHAIYMKANKPYCVQHTILVVTLESGAILHKYTLSRYYVYKHEEVICGGYLLPADSWFAEYSEEVAEGVEVKEILRKQVVEDQQF